MGRININLMYKICISSTISTCFCHKICIEIYCYTCKAKVDTDVNDKHENMKLNKFLRANGW